MPAAARSIVDITPWGSTGRQMIIWGSRTAPNAKGFVIRACPCGGDRVHIVAELKTKFTLYFVPTFTYAKKVMVICTDCERLEELYGPAAEQTLAATVSKDAMVTRLEAAARGASPPPVFSDTGAAPVTDLGVAFLIMMTTVAFTDRRIVQREVAAGLRSLSTIAAATASPTVRDAASLGRDRYDELMAWIQAPSTGPLAPMLERAGRRARSLAQPDRMRCIGQLAWLGQEVAAVSADATGAPSPAALDRIDDAFAKMGITPRETAEALAWCERFGG